MAVIEMRRATQATEEIRIAKRAPPQIFIAHSSLSKNLLTSIERGISTERVQPFIANHVPSGTGMADAITHAIDNSDALFIVLTKNTLKRQSMRDWVLFELGFAQGSGRKATSKRSDQKTIHVWKETTTHIPSTNPIRCIEGYRSLQMNSKKSRDQMLAEMRSIARTVSMRRGIPPASSKQAFQTSERRII